MSRIEPFNIGLLRPRGPEREAQALRYSLAARCEEPQLRFAAPEGYLLRMLKPERGSQPLSIAQMELEKLFESRGSQGLVIARTSAEGRDIFAVFCRYSLRSIGDLNDEPAISSDPPDDYLDLLQRERVMVDPLVLAQPGLEASQLEPLKSLGTQAYLETFPEGGEIEFRIVSAPGEVKQLQKLFSGGFLSSLPEPLLMDGPFSFAGWQVSQGHEWAFACLVPVGQGMSELVLNEVLLVKENPGENPSERVTKSGSEDSTGEEESQGDKTQRHRVEDNPPIEFGDESGLKLQRYYYSDDSSRDWATNDWSEDLRLESDVADVSALLFRDLDEFDLVVGERSHAPRSVEELHVPDALFKDALIEVLPFDQRAARAFLDGRGHAAIWTPRRDGVDMTQRLLVRPPRLARRRAMMSFLPYVPLGYVIQMGL